MVTVRPSTPVHSVPDRSYRELFEHTTDAVLFTIPDGTILAANPAACALLGATAEEILARGRTGFSDPDDPRWRRALEERARTGTVRAVLPMVRADGTPFEAEITSSLFWEPVGHRGCVIIRDVTEQVQMRRRLEATNQITRSLFAGDELNDVLTTVVRSACQLVQATEGVLLTAGTLPGVLVVTAADGTRVQSMLGRKFPPGTMSAAVIASRRSVVMSDLSSRAMFDEGRRLELGPAMVVPIVSGSGPFGNIVVARERGQPLFSAADLDVVESFAESAGIALALRDAEASAMRSEVFAEKARIAADLHDNVIQELFGVGLRLHAIADEAPPAVADRILHSIDALDTTIEQVRNTIFDLQWTHEDIGLPKEVRLVAAEAEELGVHVTTEVRSDLQVGTPVASQMLFVLREALSNVVRHAHAARARIRVVVEDDELVLRVSDDGVGPPRDSRSAGLGLRNMERRAVVLGGSFEVKARRPRGTVVEWRVPLPGP